MTVRQFIIGAVVSMIVSGGIWLLIITWLDPTEAGGVGFLLFFLALFLVVASVAALVGYGLRRILAPQQLSPYRLRPALRQGVLLGIFMDVLFFLQLQRLLRWWITVILIVMLISIEFLFLSYGSKSQQNRTAREEGTS